MLKKIFIKTFGCQMNEYDSNRIFDIVKKIGFDKTEKYEDADRFLRIYLSKNTKDLNIRYTLAGILFKKNMLEDAQTELDLILQLDPENTKAIELSNKIQDEQKSAQSSNG